MLSFVASCTPSQLPNSTDGRHPQSAPSFNPQPYHGSSSQCRIHTGRIWTSTSQRRSYPMMNLVMKQNPRFELCNFLRPSLPSSLPPFLTFSLSFLLSLSTASLLTQIHVSQKEKGGKKAASKKPAKKKPSKKPAAKKSTKTKKK
jgi:hypothetical protein